MRSGTAPKAAVVGHSVPDGPVLGLVERLRTHVEPRRWSGDARAEIGALLAPMLRKTPFAAIAIAIATIEEARALMEGEP